MNLHAAITAMLATSVSACLVDQPGAEDLTSPGQAQEFAAYLQPIVESGCGSLDCHGQDGRPLRLYGLYGLRLAGELRGLPATDEEITANMLAITGLDPGNDDASTHLSLLKPLAVNAGGIEHVGGELWPNRDHFAYLCFLAWLRDGLTNPSDQDTCMEAL